MSGPAILSTKAILKAVTRMFSAAYKTPQEYDLRREGAKLYAFAQGAEEMHKAMGEALHMPCSCYGPCETTMREAYGKIIGKHVEPFLRGLMGKAKPYADVALAGLEDLTYDTAPRTGREFSSEIQTILYPVFTYLRLLKDELGPDLGNGYAALADNSRAFLHGVEAMQHAFSAAQEAYAKGTDNVEKFSTPVTHYALQGFIKEHLISRVNHFGAACYDADFFKARLSVVIDLMQLVKAQVDTSSHTSYAVVKPWFNAGDLRPSGLPDPS